MHISPININTNFKAKLSPEVKELLLNGAENIAAEKGKNSRVYKKYKNNIKKILDNSPETRVDIVSIPRFDDVYFYSYAIVYIFSWAIFFFIPGYFTFEVVNKDNEILEKPEAQCSSSFSCLLYFLNYAPANGGNISSNLASFKNGINLYLTKFFIEVIFFQLLNWIFTNIVLALVTNSFEMVTKRNKKNNYDKNTKCFICETKKENLYHTKQCNHLFCNECGRSYFEQQTEKGIFSLKCLKYDCNKNLLLNDIKSFLNPEIIITIKIIKILALIKKIILKAPIKKED